MTTKTDDIKLPPLPDLPKYRSDLFDPEVNVVDACLVEELMQSYARTAVEADRQNHLAHVRKMVPSNEEIIALWQAISSERGVQTTSSDAERLSALNRVMAYRYGSSQPIVSAEPVVRYCPGCGSIGPVSAGYANCCPDGNQARMIPRALAEKCHDIFMIAVKAMMAESANDPVAPVAREPADPTLPDEQALSELIDKIVPGLDTGDILADARQASAALGLGGTVAQEPVAWPLVTWWDGAQGPAERLAESLENYARIKPGANRDIWAMRAAAKWIRAVLSAPVAAQDDDATLADTQRQIIEAAEQRGYARAVAECAQDREDADIEVLAEHSGCGRGTQVEQVTVKLNPGDKVVMVKGRITRAFDAADAARAAKGVDHG